jgi:hypothetical protein
MKRCLDERVLVLLSVGDGTAAEREHCDGCPACATRLRAVITDLGGIGEVLREAPPPFAPRLPRRLPAWRLVPALTIAMLVAAVGVHRLFEARPRDRVDGAGVGDASLSASAEEVSDALFDTSGERALLAMALPSSAGGRQVLTEAPEVERALGLGAPCTGERFVGADCSDYTSALFF